MANPKKLSDQLRRALKNSEKSCYRISQETGIPEGNLSRFIHGKAGFSIDSLDKLCKCLSLKLSDKDDG